MYVKHFMTTPPCITLITYPNPYTTPTLTLTFICSLIWTTLQQNTINEWKVIIKVSLVGNSLPITIQTARTTNTFWRLLKAHLFSGNTAIDELLPSVPTIRTSVLTYGALQMQTTYLLTYISINN